MFIGLSFGASARAENYDRLFTGQRGEALLQETKEDFHHYLHAVASLNDAEKQLRALRRDERPAFNTTERAMENIRIESLRTIARIEGKMGGKEIVAAWGRAQMPRWLAESELIRQRAMDGGRPPLLKDDPHRQEVEFALENLPPAYLRWGAKPAEQAPAPRARNSSSGGKFGYGGSR